MRHGTDNSTTGIGIGLAATPHRSRLMGTKATTVRRSIGSSRPRSSRHRRLHTPGFRSRILRTIVARPALLSSRPLATRRTAPRRRPTRPLTARHRRVIRLRSTRRQEAMCRRPSADTRLLQRILRRRTAAILRRAILRPAMGRRLPMVMGRPLEDMPPCRRTGATTMTTTGHHAEGTRRGGGSGRAAMAATPTVLRSRRSPSPKNRSCRASWRPPRKTMAPGSFRRSWRSATRPTETRSMRRCGP
mmetsp:Transcript_80766/g.234240  ORF Transcript_80766/g.234240 Transcript_80766/m.234240 type:complete len:246 (+) Transcript_80766:493-1230(+)